jgi:sugar phosphate isomerase/epimerase
MTQLFSLAHLTLLALPPAQLVDVAASTGYDCVGLRLLPGMPGGVAYPLMDDPGLLGETLARIHDTGVGVFDLEIVRLNEAFDVRNFLRFFEVGATLGARAMLVAGEDRDQSRLAQSFAALCEAAKPFGLTADVEFMPWHAVNNLGSAVRLIEVAGRPTNAGILLDALHFSRARTSLDDVRRLPREWLHYAQLCDAPAEIPATMEEMIHAGRFERLLPGEGGIDLAGLFGALPPGVPVSVEIPNVVRVPVVGELEWVRQALIAGKALIKSIGR